MGQLFFPLSQSYHGRKALDKSRFRKPLTSAWTSSVPVLCLNYSSRMLPLKSNQFKRNRGVVNHWREIAGLVKLYVSYKKGDNHSPGDDAVHKMTLLTNRSCVPLFYFWLPLPIPATLLPWACL